MSAPHDAHEQFDFDASPRSADEELHIYLENRPYMDDLGIVRDPAGREIADVDGYFDDQRQIHFDNIQPRYDDMTAQQLARVVAKADQAGDKATHLNASASLLEKLGETPHDDKNFNDVLNFLNSYKALLDGPAAKSKQPKKVVRKEEPKAPVVNLVRPVNPPAPVKKPKVVIHPPIKPAPKVPEQPKAQPEHAKPQSAEKSEKLKYKMRNFKGIHNVSTLGKDDPLDRIERGDKRYPEVMYHGSHLEDFRFDEMFDGEHRGIGNNVLGNGLYCGVEPIAERFAEGAARRHGLPHRGSVATVYPKQAKIIEADEPQPPMNDVLINEFISFLDAKIENPRFDQHKTTYEDIRADLVRQIDMPQDLRSNILEYVFTRYWVAPAQAFLMAKGIDGVAAIRQTRYGTSKIVAFWRHDRIGDEQTWKRRNREQQIIDSIGSNLASHIDENANRLATEESTYTGNVHKLVSRNLSISEVKKMIGDTNALRLPADKAAHLWNYLGREEVNPLAAVSQLAGASPQAAKLLAAKAGVWEGYDLHEHTQAVLGQFEKHFKHYFEGNAAHQQNARAFLRTVLLLQDIGKPIYALSDKNKEQSDYNKLVSREMLENFPISTDLKNMMSEIIGQDVIGRAVKHRTRELEDFAVHRLKQLSKKYEIFSEKEMSVLAELIYKADASSYTSDASYVEVSKGRTRRVYCKESLGHLFKHTDRANRLVLNGLGEGVAQRIRRRIQRGTTQPTPSHTQTRSVHL